MEKEIKIIHIMADGTIRNSMEGVVVPMNDRTRRAYEILANDQKNRKQNEPNGAAS